MLGLGRGWLGKVLVKMDGREREEKGERVRETIAWANKGGMTRRSSWVSTINNQSPSFQQAWSVY